MTSSLAPGSVFVYEATKRRFICPGTSDGQPDCYAELQVLNRTNEISLTPQKSASGKFTADNQRDFTRDIRKAFGVIATHSLVGISEPACIVCMAGTLMRSCWSYIARYCGTRADCCKRLWRKAAKETDTNVISPFSPVCFVRELSRKMGMFRVFHGIRWR